MPVQAISKGHSAVVSHAPREAERGEDPVLASLDAAERAYREMRDDLDRQRGDCAQAIAERDQARETERRLTLELHQLREQAAHERRRAERHAERSKQLAESLGHIHRALFDGNVYNLILRACMSITGATRGLYVTAWGDNLRLRAAVDVDGYPAAPPSDFLKALCRRVQEDEETLVVHGPDDKAAAGLPEPKPGERFRNFIVAPAIVLKHFSGIVLLADKAGGHFDEDDVDMVLGIGKQGGVAVENRHLQDELFGAYFSVVGVLADAVEAKDPYTRGHCELVARYARRTAHRLGLTPAELSIVSFGGLLHDVGKIGISDGVLNKAGKLMPEEWDLMRSHVRIGRDLLARVPALKHVAEVVLHHHERYDGAGYPDGLVAEQISMASRIICVTDAYCAMISKRSYKDSMDESAARAELLSCRGSHFDPAVVDAFVAVLDDPQNTADDCPDGFGAPEDHYHPLELRHALERPTANGAKPAAEVREPVVQHASRKEG